MEMLLDFSRLSIIEFKQRKGFTGFKSILLTKRRHIIPHDFTGTTKIYKQFTHI